MIVGLNATVPAAVFSGLTANGVPAALAHQLAALPPISYLFASFLGYNPLATLLGPVLGQLPPADVANLTGRAFFPSLISGPFQHRLGRHRQRGAPADDDGDQHGQPGRRGVGHESSRGGDRIASGRRPWPESLRRLLHGSTDRVARRVGDAR